MRSKAELREIIIADISSLPDEYISASDKGIERNAMLLKQFAAAQNIMVYYSVKREPATLSIARAALSMGKTLAFPFCYRGGIMEARIVHSLDELHPAMLGIPAPAASAPIIPPSELNMILVPALAYDRNGHRLGYGGGYYDRYLYGIPAFKAGLARNRLMKYDLPIDPYDVAVDCVITEEGYFCPTLPKK